MKIHRLILIERSTPDASRIPVAAIEDEVTLEEACRINGVFSIDFAPHIRKALLDGDTWRFDYTFAGVRVHGRLVPSRSPASARTREEVPA